MPIQQVRLAKAAPTLITITLSLNSSAIYLGAALGATLGGLVLSHVGPAAVAWVAAACDIAGLAAVVYSLRRSAPAAATDGESFAAFELAGE